MKKSKRSEMRQIPAEKLPPGKQLAYATGQLGWSTLINIVNLQLVYFYIPPADAGIPTFITQTVFLTVLNTLTLIAASGRLLDAITDPLIANLSDRWESRFGRRIPFLAAGALPTALFCVLMFVPLTAGQSGGNIVWLVVTQIGFYLFLTVYVTPYFALLPELGHTATERLNLSTWISITYALGIILASQVPTLAQRLDSALGGDRVAAWQTAIAAVAAIAVLLMLVPVFFIEEKRYSVGQRSEIPLRQALRRTFRNRNFIFYVVADFTYFMGLTITMTGLLYYITVLLGLNETRMGTLLPLLIIISFLFYPAVNLIARKTGKKPLVVGAFFLMSGVFFGIYFLGRWPFSPLGQAYALIILLAVPIAFLGILPNAILADIAEHDAHRTGIHQEGMFFAARTLMQKFGQTFGVLIFAALTSLGKDPGHDLGIRLSGIIGWGLCLLAGLYFMRYDERRLLAELEETGAGPDQTAHP